MKLSESSRPVRFLILQWVCFSVFVFFARAAETVYLTTLDGRYAVAGENGRIEFTACDLSGATLFEQEIVNGRLTILNAWTAQPVRLTAEGLQAVNDTGQEVVIEPSSIVDGQARFQMEVAGKVVTSTAVFGRTCGTSEVRDSGSDPFQFEMVKGRVLEARHNDLQEQLDQTKPGDVILVSGVHDRFPRQPYYNFTYAEEQSRASYQTEAAGTFHQPIIIRGDGTAVLRGMGTDSAQYGLCILHDYYMVEDLTVEKVKKGVVVENANHGVFRRVTVREVENEGFKFRYNAQHFLVEDCLAEDTGRAENHKSPGIGRRNGEGFYVGNAASNWAGAKSSLPPDPQVPDVSGFITFINCTARSCRNDGFDFKEGSHDIKVINCLVDWSTDIEPLPNADQSDAGIYLRGDRIQIINTTVLNSEHWAAAIKTAHATVDRIAYGHSLELYGVVGRDFGPGDGLIHLKGLDGETTLYGNYTLDRCQLYQVTEHPDDSTHDVHRSPDRDLVPVDSSAFKEMTWDGIEGARYMTEEKSSSDEGPVAPLPRLSGGG